MKTGNLIRLPDWTRSGHFWWLPVRLIENSRLRRRTLYSRFLAGRSESESCGVGPGCFLYDLGVKRNRLRSREDLFELMCSSRSGNLFLLRFGPSFYTRRRYFRRLAIVVVENTNARIISAERNYTVNSRGSQTSFSYSAFTNRVLAGREKVRAPRPLLL